MFKKVMALVIVPAALYGIFCLLDYGVGEIRWRSNTFGVMVYYITLLASRYL